MAKANAPSISASDQEEIRALVMRGQKTWNRQDMKASAEHTLQALWKALDQAEDLIQN